MLFFEIMGVDLTLDSSTTTVSRATGGMEHGVLLDSKWNKKKNNKNIINVRKTTEKWLG